MPIFLEHFPGLGGKDQFYRLTLEEFNECVEHLNEKSKDQKRRSRGHASHDEVYAALANQR